MVDRSHAEIQQLLGAYAIDALDDDERVAVDAHLGRCPGCRAEVGELREVAAQLAPAKAVPPEGIWDRIVGSLEVAPPPLRLEVVPIEQARRRRSRIAIAAVSVAAALLAFLAVQLRDTSTSSDKLRAAALEALAKPTSRVAVLKTPGGDPVARVVVTDQGQGYVFGEDMKPLDNKIYELWGATAQGRVVALGVMDQPSVRAFTVNGEIKTIMVTEEDHPVDQTRNTPIVAGDLA